jgi:sugar transferase (PEP-CTERM/EpsH1 system associated)
LKILFLANRIPFPPYRGDKLKIYNLAKRLAVKHELHLLTFTQTEEDKLYKKELEPIFKEVHFVHQPQWKSVLQSIKHCFSDLPFQVAYFQSPTLRKTLDKLLQQHHFDAIHIQHLRMAPYLNERKDLPRILDLPDAYSLYWERRKNIKRGLLTTLFENIEQNRVLQYEQKVLKQFQQVLLCSREDLEYLEEKHQVHHLRLLPNGVDAGVFHSDHHDYRHNHTLLFTGNMDYAPNVDAVIYFTKEILPLIHQQHPHVHFIIAGQRPVARVLELANEKIKVTGFIQDLAKVYDDASVVVAPLRFGAGTQNKVLEAMSVGVPVVCSHIGFKGLGIESGEGAVMQTETKAFAQSVCDLLASESLRKEMGEKGKEIIRSRFDWDVIAGMLEGYFYDLVGKKG